MGRARELKSGSVECIEFPFFNHMNKKNQSHVLGQHQKLVHRLGQVEKVQVQSHHTHVFWH